MPRFDYISDPEEIERRSFHHIRKLTDLSKFDTDQEQVAMRLVHTCGDPSITKDLYFSNHAVQAGMLALKQASTVILCDVEMVNRGISRKYIQNPVYCFLNHLDIKKYPIKITRAMSAMQHWLPYMANSIVVIGNAPTVLFSLLNLLDSGSVQPALIIGMPVGFINAAEAKQALHDIAPSEFNTPCITILGCRGGSNLAAATINAIARMNNGIRF